MGVGDVYIPGLIFRHLHFLPILNMVTHDLDLDQLIHQSQQLDHIFVVVEVVEVLMSILVQE